MLAEFLNYLIIIVWISPIFYTSLVALGKFFNYYRKQRLSSEKIRADLVIFQIPTIGNVECCNKIFETVKNYKLPVKLETWVIIEEGDPHKDEYRADRVLVVPKTFECEDLYKARALEYARRYRIELYKKGELPAKYLVLQADDDALPSEEFIRECLKTDADVIIGSMRPRSIGVWNTLLDYERAVACGTFCNFFTNIGKPVFGHGEGMCISHVVDMNVSYDLSDITKSNKVKLVSSEDLFYLHKASISGYRIFNSEKPIYITPPLTLKDAVKQRRRWVWGHINIVRHKLLPVTNIVRLALIEFSGLAIYYFATLGIPLHYLRIISIPPSLIPIMWATLLLWFGFRGYTMGKLMGWKHALLGASTSYITVTLNFIVHIISILKGDPKKFEVIKKIV